jgi:hypothetical protein
MDTKKIKQDDLWKPCPKGMIQRVADRTVEESRVDRTVGKKNDLDRRRILQIAAAVAVTTAAGTIAYRSQFAPASRKGQRGITCGTCVKNIKQYVQKTLDDQQLATKMDAHLKKCKSCRAKYEQIRLA